MNNEENNKKTWETPEVIDFDLDKTRGGKNFREDEYQETTGPS